MVGGRLACLGSGQYLKSRFGAQYEIEGRILPDVVEDGDETNEGVSRSSNSKPLPALAGRNHSRLFASYSDAINSIIIPQLAICSLNPTNGSITSDATDSNTVSRKVEDINASASGNENVSRIPDVAVEVEELHGSYFRLKVLSLSHDDKLSGGAGNDASGSTTSFDLAKAFALLESYKSVENSTGRALLQSYSVTQSSLEQIFIKMAAEHTTGQHRATYTSVPISAVHI
jgi:hypothetical protein